jgi:hypothetical protein
MLSRPYRFRVLFILAIHGFGIYSGGDPVPIFGMMSEHSPIAVSLR